MTKNDKQNNKLTMTFDPLTIEHLGVRMYSTLPPVLAELVANAYDADADNVKIILLDKDKNKEIIISDDGIGMSFDDINQKFLRIGRNRRAEDGDKISAKGRKAIGKKGLGKLAFFGIAHEIEISSKKDGKENVFLMKWEDIKNSSDKEYSPTLIKKDERCSHKEHGTMIILRKIQRESDFAPEDLSVSLSRIFILDPSFSITIQHNSGDSISVNNDKKYADLKKEVDWNVQPDIKMDSDYPNKEKVTGYLFTTEKPIPPKTNMRGVTLFSRKKLVNWPEYFSDSTSSHFFSYLTGWLEVDFVDDLGEDVISTNRQMLNWGHPEMEKLRIYLRSMLNWMEQDWRKRRAEAREKKITEKTGVNITDWFSKLPEDIRVKMEPILSAITKESELPEEIANKAVKSIHEIVPEYPRYHWRHLHPKIKDIAKEDYVNKNYFKATELASRLYISEVKDKAQVDDQNDSNNMDKAFNLGNGKLLITDCNSVTERTIQNGQHFLSKGVVAGCRNPLDHSFPKYKEKLVDTGLFSEEDCLDMLSLLSHLFGRLDNAKNRQD
ncbi:MAG: TIGR02391 family protein [Parcubacteria group bacterium]|jgi:uncharacterized protein (TIGR02391 family)